MESHVRIPSTGEKIVVKSGVFEVPDCPLVPYIEGDGIGVDITPVMKAVVDAAVKKAYGGKRFIKWFEVFAGEKAAKLYGNNQWLPEETLKTITEYGVAIKGPMTTPVGGGIRSLNVAIRQHLDLYVCKRPIRYFKGVPSLIKHPDLVDMVIFRENSEDIYAGVEFEADSPESKHLIQILQDDFKVSQIRHSEHCGIGVKFISRQGSKRLIKQAIQYAIDTPGKDSVTLVHKGNIMKFTEGSFMQWGYEVARDDFGAVPLDGGPWHVITCDSGRKIVIKDVIADAFLQNILLHTEDYDVIATMNLNGDYISDALAAMVGGIGIAPGANIGDRCAVFEATHGTVPKYAGQNKVNPLSLVLSACMMLQQFGWHEADKLIQDAIEICIHKKQVTYDFARGMSGVSALSTSDFGRALIDTLRRNDSVTPCHDTAMKDSKMV